MQGGNRVAWPPGFWGLKTMATNFTLFDSALVQGWVDDVTDASLSRSTDQLNRTSRLGVLRSRKTEIGLANSVSYTLPISGLSLAQWHYIIVRCIGSGSLTLASQDFVGGAITSVIPVYGTALLPGYIKLSTYNLTAAPIITSNQDGTVFEVLDCTCVEDGQ